ncbi:MAG TPA: hypothetical protein VIV27_00125 [Halioglobus sp.]
MITLIINLALFFLVMFVVVPALMVFAMVARDSFYKNRRHVDRYRTLMGKTPA